MMLHFGKQESKPLSIQRPTENSLAGITKRIEFKPVKSAPAKKIVVKKPVVVAEKVIAAGFAISLGLWWMPQR